MAHKHRFDPIPGAVKPDKNGILNYEMWSQGEYGPHHAMAA
jgi:hypothetical protein